MNEVPAHLVDSVIPHVSVRQWVISFPFSVRYVLAYKPQLVTGVLAIFNRIVSNSIVKRARRQGVQGKTGAITFVQRFGGAITLSGPLPFRKPLRTGQGGKGPPDACLHEARIHQAFERRSSRQVRSN